MKRNDEFLSVLFIVCFFIVLIVDLLNSCSYNDAGVQQDTNTKPSSQQVSLSVSSQNANAAAEPQLTEPEEIDTDTLAPYEPDDADFQFPEYPTGCEGVSASVMLRMNGIEVSNEEFFNALPQGGGNDFVHAFWGAPDTHAGFACMAPAIAETCERFVTSEETVLDLTGLDLSDLPAPSVVWTTMYFSEPMPSEYEQEGYHLFYNTHCVVLLSCDEEQVHVWDPLQGYQDVALETFDRLYNVLGRQAVYIVHKGYIKEEEGVLMEERKDEFEALMQQVEDGAYNGDGPEDVAPVSVGEDEGDEDGE